MKKEIELIKEFMDLIGDLVMCGDIYADERITEVMDKAEKLIKGE